MAGALYEPESDLVGQGHRILYGNAPPAAASDAVGLTFAVGDRMYNTNPGPGAVLGWICTTAGSPGSWSEMANIQGVGFTFTNTQVNAMEVTPLTLVAAQGAGTVIEVVSCLLELVYGSAAFANGGAIAMYYVNNAGTLASTTVAATFLTSPAVNQMALLTGAMASAAATTVENVALVLSNAAAPFITGTGSTLNARLRYRVHSTLA